MWKKIWFFLVISFSSFLYSIDIHLSPDIKIKISPQDITDMKQFLREEYRFIVEEEGAKRLVKENRILANVFIKSPYFKNFNLNLLKIKIEKILSEEFVKKVQSSIDLSPKILKSYYYDNLEKFRLPPKFVIKRYSFKTYDQAFSFYKRREKNLSTPPGDFGVSSSNVRRVSLSQLREPLKSLVEDNLEKNLSYTKYLTPPLVISSKRVDVYEIEKEVTSKSKKFYDFEQVKEEIKSFLYKKAFSQEREKLLSKYYPDNNEKE